MNNVEMSKLMGEDVFNLLAKKLTGEISVQEDNALKDIIESSDESKTALENAHHIWSTKCFPEIPPEVISQKENNEKIWQASFGKESKNYSKKKFGVFMRFAAIFIVIISAAFVIFFMTEQPESQKIEVTTIQKHTLPGQKSSITLRDGTIVWLNSGSSISYWTDYNENIRLIELEGQAFFEVFKDESKPFLVKCRGLKIEALGTSFDVNAYNDAPIQVSLLTGSVKLTTPWYEQANDSLILKPGEYSVIGENNKFIEKGNFDPYEILAWKEGRLIFDNLTIEEILPKLELWYGVEISNQLNFNLNKPYSSTFEQENLDNILMNMGEVLNFDYKIKGNDVTLKN
jgi:ferric-dicitrate binding protein FerR (iron transport regulator)